MRHSFIVLSALLTTACSQPAAEVVNKGDLFFGKNGNTYAASAPKPLGAGSYTAPTYQTSRNASSPAYSNETTSVANINSVSSQDLAPIGEKKSSGTISASAAKPAANAPQKSLWQSMTSSSQSDYIMPATSKIAANYGAGKSKKSESMHFKGTHGEPVYAAADGTTAFASDELKSYGNMIIIKHKNNLNTSYAHLSRMVVAKGSEVKQGQIIGYMGSSDMQFTMRNGTSPVNPNLYISTQLAAK